MIDIHAHILPNVDDGSPNLATSLEMLRIAEESGTTHIIATPHVVAKTAALNWSDILIRVQELQQKATLSGLKIKVYPGAELEMNWDILDLLPDFGKNDSNNLYGLAGTEYVLLELPGSMVPQYADELLFELRIRGRLPVLAHPERHLMIMDQLDTLCRWRDAGVLTQINAGSLTGLYGPTAKRNAEFLLNKGWIDFIGSDAHNSMHRNTCLSKCERLIGDLLGETVARSLMHDAGLRIVGRHEPATRAQSATIDCVAVPALQQQVIPEKIQAEKMTEKSSEQVAINGLRYNSWDCELSSATSQDIDETSVFEYFKKAQMSGRLHYDYNDANRALKAMGFLHEGRMSNVAKLMFATHSGLEMQMAIFATSKRLTFNDIKRVQGNIPQLIAAAERYIRNNINWRVKLDGNMQRHEVPEVPMEAIREALVNSFCHRDYTMAANNEVSIYRDRIEIYSVGQFPAGFKPNDFIKGGERSVQRNPALAKVLYYSRDVESFGTGLKRIDDVCKRAKIKVEFKMLKTGFLVSIYRRSSKNTSKNRKSSLMQMKNGDRKTENN